MSLLDKVIPLQHTGVRSTTETRTVLKNTTDAITLFASVCKRLLEVNAWHHFAGKGTAEFQLFNSMGNQVYRPVKEGDFFQIDVPGPGSKTGRGKDWVQVVKMDRQMQGDEEILYFTVRTSADPLSFTSSTAHFFAQTATSTFVAYRSGNEVMAGVFGRNEKANTQTPRLLDRIRNALFAIGAWIGLSKLQWKALTDGLVYFAE